LSYEEKERVIFSFLFFIVLTISVLLTPFDEGPFPTCIFYSVTNLPCPACGLTRSFIYLVHLEIIESLIMNPFGLIIFIFWGWVSIKDVLEIFFHVKTWFFPKPVFSVMKKWFVIAFLVFGGFRLILHITDFNLFHSIIHLYQKIY
jgi:hypothetical protein